LPPRPLRADDAKELWPCLLAIFERCIVSTHRSKFTQFLVFYMCSRQPPALCAASFIELLIARLRDARQPPITRSAR
jgi:RNA polymerase I-specific transcription initiation factor RRN3